MVSCQRPDANLVVYGCPLSSLLCSTSHCFVYQCWSVFVYVCGGCCTRCCSCCTVLLSMASHTLHETVLSHVIVHAGEACAVYVQHQETKRVLLGIVLGRRYPYHHTDEGYQQCVLQKRCWSLLGSWSYHSKSGHLLQPNVHEGTHGEPDHNPVTLLQIAPRNDRPPVKLGVYCQRTATRRLHHREDEILSF